MYENTSDGGYDYYGFGNDSCYPIAQAYGEDPIGRWVAASNGALATLLNAFVFTVMVSDKQLRKRPAAWLIINQCVADGLIGFTLMLMATLDNGRSRQDLVDRPKPDPKNISNPILIYAIAISCNLRWILNKESEFLSTHKAQSQSVQNTHICLETPELPPRTKLYELWLFTFD